MTGYDHSHPETFLDILAQQLFEEGANILNGFNNKHPDYYMELIIRTNFLPHYAPIKERFWHIYNKSDIKPICEYEGCMSPVTWHKVYAKHNKYCSKTCARSDYWTKKRKKEAESSNSV